MGCGSRKGRSTTDEAQQTTEDHGAKIQASLSPNSALIQSQFSPDSALILILGDSTLRAIPANIALPDSITISELETRLRLD